MAKAAGKLTSDALHRYVEAAVEKITGGGHYATLRALGQNDGEDVRFSVVVARSYASAGGIISETLQPMVEQLQGAGVYVDVIGEKKIAPDATDDYTLHLTVAEGAEAVRKLNVLTAGVTETLAANSHDPNLESPISQILAGDRDASSWQR